MVVSFIVLASLHAANPAKYGPAGGVENLRGALRLLTQIRAVAAVPIGVNAGGSDLASGVYVLRERHSQQGCPGQRRRRDHQLSPSEDVTYVTRKSSVRRSRRRRT